MSQQPRRQAVALMRELVVRVLKKLERSSDAADGRASTRRICVHTANGDVTVKLRFPA